MSLYIACDFEYHAYYISLVYFKERHTVPFIGKMFLIYQLSSGASPSAETCCARKGAFLRKTASQRAYFVIDMSRQNVKGNII